MRSRSGVGTYHRALFAYFKCPKCTHTTWHAWILGRGKPIIAYCEACSSAFILEIGWAGIGEGALLLVLAACVGAFGGLAIGAESGGALGLIASACIAAVCVGAAWPAFCRKRFRYDWVSTLPGKFQRTSWKSAIVPGVDPHAEAPAPYDPERGWKKYMYPVPLGDEMDRDIVLPVYNLRRVPRPRCCVCVRHGAKCSETEARAAGWVIKQKLIDQGIRAEHIEIRVSNAELLAGTALLLFGGDDDLWWDQHCAK